jgi:hypothetical protein
VALPDTGTAPHRRECLGQARARVVCEAAEELNWAGGGSFGRPGANGEACAALCLRPGALPTPLRFELRLAPRGAFGGSGVALAGGYHSFTISSLAPGR